jgi:hypothetical protein
MDRRDLVEKIARVTGADQRTVLKRLAGIPVRGAAGPAIDAALDREGIQPNLDLHATRARGDT